MSKTTDSISSTCVLCCSGIKYYAVGHCNHHICLKCSTRMRVLCEQRYCAVCRADMPKVIATAKLHPFSGIISHKFPVDRKAGIAFQMSKIQDEFRRLLWEVCTLCRLRPPEKSAKDLQDHLRREHELFYCNLCIKHLKVFSFERKAYTRKDLALHRRKGDGKDTSYRGHPLCEFCDDRYFDNDELLRHLRQDHYYCHFCEADGASNQYYHDYDNLKVHFGEQHYLCEEDRCAQEQFTHAFRSSIDLKAHRATAHSNQMSRAQARQMRQIDVEIKLPPRLSERGSGGGGSSFARRERRYYGNRDEGLSTALQASMETKRQATAERKEREDRDNRRTRDKAQPRKNLAANAEPEADRDTSGADASGDAVAVETAAKETVKDEGKMQRKGGRTSPRVDEAKTAAKEERQQPSVNNTKCLEDGTGMEKSDTGVPQASETDKQTGKKKKNKKGKGASDSSENESSLSAPKPVHSKPVQTSQSSDDARAEMRPPQPVARMSSGAKVDDFPALVASAPANVGTTGAPGGFNFYSALQKMDTQSNPQQQPVAVPAQRSFKNREEDFPTLSSIAGILGVEAAPRGVKPTSETKSTSAWTSSNDKPVAPSAKAKPVAGTSTKKRKKLSKENQDVAARKQNSKSPPRCDSAKKGAVPKKSPLVPLQHKPPGLPPGLQAKGPPVSGSQPKPPAASHPVSPPPGFGGGAPLPHPTLPPGFDVFVPPTNFQQRNLELATKIKAFLGPQEAKFYMFRSISRKFRDGSMTAAEYYHECQALLGPNLAQIFNELVSLLPDLVKQQELISAKNDAKWQSVSRKDNSALTGEKTEPVRVKVRGRGPAARMEITNASSVCPQCGLATNRLELEAHLNMHKEFPSLSAKAVGKRQPITGAAPTWPRLT